MREKPVPAEVSGLLSAVDPETRERFEPNLMRALNACGCTSGGVALVAGVALAIAWWLTGPDSGLPTWQQGGIAAGGVIVLTLLAKAGGILTARVWVAVVVRRLRTQVRAGAGEAR